jgi:hypothetical protein
MKTVAEILAEKNVLANQLFELETAFGAATQANPALSLRLGKFRDKLRGSDKDLFDASEWDKLIFREGASIRNVSAFCAQYTALSNLIALRGGRSKNELLTGLQHTVCAANLFEERASALFAEVYSWISDLNLAGYDALPAFEKSDFERDLRRVQESDLTGYLFLVQATLDKLHFLSYLVDSSPS